VWGASLTMALSGSRRANGRRSSSVMRPAAAACRLVRPNDGRANWVEAKAEMSVDTHSSCPCGRASSRLTRSRSSNDPRRPTYQAPTA
jgi:hypothetical protein